MSTLAAVIKVSLDQCLMAPVGLACFFISMKVQSGRQCLCRAGHQSLTHFRLAAGPMQVMEGESGRRAMEEMRSKIAPALLATWTIWPLANLVGPLSAI